MQGTQAPLGVTFFVPYRNAITGKQFHLQYIFMKIFEIVAVEETLFLEKNICNFSVSFQRYVSIIF